MTFDAKVQALYTGSETGVAYTALDGGRLRYLGGSTNHWGGWCRPLDAIDFESARLGAPFRLAVHPQGAGALFRPRPVAGRSRALDL